MYAEELRIVVLVDDMLSNRGKELGLLPAHGLSLFIEARLNGKTIKLLFDTGPVEEILRFNSKSLGINLDDIEYIFISNWKQDHSSLLNTMLKYPVKAVWAPPQSESLTLCKPPRDNRIHFVKSRDPLFLFHCAYSTGVSGRKWYSEHGAVVRLADERVVVILGCSAYGFKDFIEKASSLGSIEAVIGGLHLSYFDEIGFDELTKLVEEYDINLIYPLHCTSPAIRHIVAETFSLKEVPGTGSVLVIR